MEQLRSAAPNLVSSIGINNATAPPVPPTPGTGAGTGTAPTAAPPNNPDAFTQVNIICFVNIY